MAEQERYSPEQQQVIDSYWDTIRFTRSTGKISNAIKQREQDYWSKYDPELVIRALNIHIEKYPNIKENYTRGILRNLKGGSINAGDRGSLAPATRPFQGKSSPGKRDTAAEEAFRRRLGGRL
ncbi:hypothetical protein [Paenibacillus sp. NPDC057967]|uniref:hypothetical protein n=1 Tax=Paenibacillus sp. NPDC057967 TaxID=3346293 RepID=UPI0036DC7A09